MAKQSVKQSFFYLWVCIGLTIVLLALQVITRLDVAISYAYVAVILLTMLIPAKKYTIVFAISAAVFILIGSYYSIPTIDPSKFSNFIYNRISAFIGIGVTAFLVLRFKNIQEKEHRSSERLNALFENAQEGMIICDTRGNIILANPEVGRQFGYAPEELAGKPAQQIIPDGAIYYNEIKQGKLGIELYGKRKNGSEFPVEVSLSNFKVSLDAYVVCFIIDKTSQKRSEEELRRGEEMSKRYLDIAPLIIVVGNTAGKITLINRKGCEILGYDENEVVGKDWIENFVAPEGRDKAREAFQNALRSGKSFEQTYENMILTKDGRKRIIAWKGTVIKDKSGQLESLLTAGEDITERKNLEEVSVALEKEKQLNELKTRFVSMASHEFRTPLSTILSSASLVQKYADQEHLQDRARHINRIKTTVRNLTNILNDFLSLDKLETGIVQPKPDTFNLDKLCAEIVAEVQTITKPGQLINYLYAGEKREIFMDKTLLRIIVNNLLNNAVKYSPEKGHIDFLVEEVNHEIIVTVKDYGIGIPEEDKEHLFDRFFRAGNSMNISGTGLGLHIVKRYTELIGGTIGFTSEVNKGTTFVVRFPFDQRI